MALGTKYNDVARETIVKDHLIRKIEDVDLEKIFEREPKTGEDIDNAQNAIYRWFFNQLHKLTKNSVQKSLTTNKHNK